MMSAGETAIRAVQYRASIPRILHQTYRTSEIPEELEKYRESWISINSGWSFRFWNDTDCLELVAREFPQYLSAYNALEKNIERADFFR